MGGEVIMSNNFTSQGGYHGLLAANSLTNVKHFDGLFTQIAVSENGYIAIYYPYEPELKKSFTYYFSPEQQERLELIHISQINDFDIKVYGDEITHVSGGAGGAIVGGLLGGTLGAVIGSSLTSGTVTSNATINEVLLVINTKDFNNSHVEVLLYKRPPQSVLALDKSKENAITFIPYGLRKHFSYSFMTGYNFDKEGKRLIKEVYNGKKGYILDCEPNVAQINVLESTLTQMLASQQQSEVATSAAPQISSADELAKFKALLDNGVITQEEFDAKKKQLLGL